jgi:hypothetical protein
VVMLHLQSQKFMNTWKEKAFCMEYGSLQRKYNGRGTAEQWIKEGKHALNRTRLSCKRFVSNRVRLWLFVLAYNRGNFLRRLVLPDKCNFSLTLRLH